MFGAERNTMIAEPTNSYSILIVLGTVYPALYDFQQIFRVGPSQYFKDPWNYVDLMYISCSISQVILHTMLGPFAVVSKIAMTVVLLLSMGKTFFYLRIFNKLSPIVTMLTKVISDLKVFMLFFFILIFKFALILDIMGIGKDTVPSTTLYPGYEF